MVRKLELLLVIDERWLMLGYVVCWGPVLVFVGLLMSLVSSLRRFLPGGIPKIIRGLMTNCVIYRLGHLVLLQNLVGCILIVVSIVGASSMFDMWASHSVLGVKVVLAAVWLAWTPGGAPS